MKWEYMTWLDDRKTASELSAIGANGWELVSVMPENAAAAASSLLRYYFKRPVADPPPPGPDNQAASQNLRQAQAPAAVDLGAVYVELMTIASQLETRFAPVPSQCNADPWVKRLRTAAGHVAMVTERANVAIKLLERAWELLVPQGPAGQQVLDDINRFRKETPC